MQAETLLTSDVVGLTKAAPFSRRGFMTASAAVAAGYTLAAGPVRADVIKTDTEGLAVGDVRIKVADFSACTNTSGTSRGVSPSSARLRSHPTIISARASI
jgi:hypothetical protein